MDKQEFDTYKWLDAQHHQPQNQNKTDTRLLQKALDFYELV